MHSNSVKSACVAVPKILLVDDEIPILESLESFLSRTGFEVSVANDGDRALRMIAKNTPDIIILDVLMPGINGRELLRLLRDEGCQTPVILLTQVGDSTERAMAIDEGADDYLNKPFDPHELVARIRSVLRRAALGEQPLNASQVLCAGDLTLNRQSRRVQIGENGVNMSPRAVQLLEYLMSHPDEILSRDRLLDSVWGWQFATGTRSVDARIAEIRKVLNDSNSKPNFIETIPGQGYRFLAKVKGLS